MDHWHKNTAANFRPLDLAVAEELVNFAATRRNIGKSIELAGRSFTLDHISHNTSAFWKSRGLSIYFQSDRSVVRISDHWSQSRGNPRSRKLNCGRISSSYWTIRNRPGEFVLCHSHSAGKYPYKMLAGILGLTGFERLAA